MRKKILFIFLFLVLTSQVCADGFFETLQGHGDVDKTPPLDKQALIFDDLEQLWAPTDISSLEVDPTVDTADEIEAILTNDPIDFGTGSVTTSDIIADDIHITDLIDLSNGTGYFNTFIGEGCGIANTGGTNNTAVGSYAFRYNTDGNSNTAIGASALVNNTTGHFNTAVGIGALQDNTTANSNIGVGDNALANNTTGTHNVVIGKETFSTIQIANYNTVIGNRAFIELTDGDNNAVFGYQAGRYQADGTTPLTVSENSIYIGYNTKGYDNNDVNAIVIGYEAIGKGANTIVLGNDSITDTYLKGNVEIRGSNLIFEGATADDFETTFSITDPTTPDKTITFQDASGIVVMDTTACTDLEGTKLSITGGVLNCTETDSVVGAITGIVKSDGGGNISAATAGTDYYNPGGTDVAVADGRTGKSSWTQYLIPYTDTTTSFSQIAIGTSGQVLTSNGAGSAPNFQDAAAGSEVSIELLPQGAKLPSSNPATIDAGNSGWRLLFDDTTQETASWEFVLNDGYGGSTLYADVYFTMASGEANEVQFEVYVMAVTPGDATDWDTDSYDTENVGVTTVAATAGRLYKQTITLTNNDSLAAGDLIRIKLSTDSDDAVNDDATGDREVRMLVIRE